MAALDVYHQDIKRKLRTVPAPTLHSLGHSSLTLSWNGYVPENVTYRAQKLVLDTSSGWQLHGEATFRPDGNIDLFNLRPFVAYKFRILIVVTSVAGHMIGSQPSGKITTRAYGVPSTGPRIRSVSSPTSQAIAVTWSPPPFTNGRLLQYSIYLQPGRQEDHNLTRIDLPWNTTSWVTGHLRSSQKYLVSITAWNSEGEGPRSNRDVFTRSPGNWTTREAPLLILASGNKILTVAINNSTRLEPQNSRIIYEHPDKTVNIIDISVHMRRRQLLAADSTGSVSLISLTGNSTAFNRYPEVKDARAVSVDWMSDSLYVASQDKIYNCPLAKDQCAIVLQGLAGTATDVEVDPINGYFYYVLNGEGQGLYRVPLQTAGQTGAQMVVQTSLLPAPPQLIIATSDISSVLIDFNNVRLYVVNSTAGTMMVASLDGCRIESLHEKTASPSFGQVSSIVVLDQTFIWTDKQHLYMQEFEPQIQKYQHSELVLFKPPYTGMSLFHPEAQPLPAPSTAPDITDAVFSRDHAVVSWNPPPLLHYQGQGAWRDWTYQLQLVKSSDEGDILDELQQYDVSELHLTITNLTPDSVYKVKARARSEAGFGPWSEECIGRTLKYDDVSILMSLSGGEISEKSIDGTEISLAQLDSDATKIDWHGDMILWVSDSDALFMYNRTTQQSNELTEVHAVSCLAYDWLGHKVYWSNQKTIHRSNLEDGRHEFICQTKAIDIAIDAVSGRLYWATELSIETSYLNGNERQEMFSPPLFSDRKIISLTLDLDSGKVLWCETSYGSSYKIFMLDLLPANYDGPLQTTPAEVRQLESEDMISSLQHFSHNFFWLTEQNTLTTGSSYNNFSSIVSSDEDLLCFTVSHPVMHSSPFNMSASKVKVIPASIDSSDLQIEGVWSKFNLTWPPQTEVTYGAVFYKLFIEAVNNSQHVTTTNHFFEMSGFLPYTQLVVSIQPLTYWGYAEATTISLRTPTSEPTAPLSPEVFVIQHKNASASHQTLAADFRWMTPKHPNGIITHHLVTHWKEGESKTTVRLNGTARHFILTPLEESQIYYFQVAACTDMGCGPESITQRATTDASTPAPSLLVISKDGVSLTEMDSDLNLTSIMSDISLKAATYLAKTELRIFWLDNNNTIFESSDSSIHEVVSLSSKGQDLTMDWISHTMYIVESTSFGGSTITQFNIETKDYKVLLSRSASVSSILVDPYNSIIIWTELASTGQSQIMKADISTGQAQAVLTNGHSRSRRSSDNRTCSCLQILNVAQVIALSYKDYNGATEVLFADSITGAIYLTDLAGCQCVRIIEPTPSNAFGLPPSLMTVDHTRVSWYNKTEGRLYSVRKATGDDMIVHTVGDVVDILAYGSQLQPLPDSQCLDPGSYSSSIDILQIANTSVSLALTAPVRPAACQGITAPVYKYTVYYRKVAGLKVGATPDDCQNDLSLCHKQQSYSTRVEVTNLEPYTQYLIQVAVSTYYTEYLAEALSKPVMLTTMFGVPGLARAVNARPFTPEQIALTWEPPLDFNGPPENINYVVQLWKAASAQGNIEKEIEIVPKRENMLAEVAVEVTQLEPDHVYNLRILTCAGNRTLCSSTEAVQCRTFKTPSTIEFINATTHSLEIQWRSPPDKEVLRHQVTYAEIAPGPLNWTKDGMPIFTDSNTEYREVVTGLKPNTLYAFKIRLSYNARPYHRAFYFWPPDETRFTHRTLVYHPDQPSPPTVTHLQSGDYEVRWEEPNDNGAPITNYILEHSNSLDKQNWKTAYNGSQEHWRIDSSGMKHGTSYVFRVAAVNSEGTGPFSEISPLFTAPLVMENSLSNHVTIGVIFGIIALLAVVILAIVFVLHKRREKIKNQQFIIRGPDTELATLRELPYNTFQQSNTLYAINIQCTDEEIAKLPHFSRSQLVLTMFLGSGAFGEVFEGLAKNIRGNGGGDTKCAVKTLRKSASDHEKEEFLKEALLMKNFQHEHILSLLGVCLDNDPQFIIMELMEGGDLLSFLRSCRATLTTPAKLTLPDIVKICLHVSRGCKYLEDMHFVHRDLAARNCLVSTKSPADMTVKIGDFGLARDIYKNDYYRKEGEGLLPVRWMSPESLVDGFFTTQSDIWAFGVLMWEAVTLGQQPYPARTNIEVLHFVRDRGKLERPDKCADEMYSLMSKCWSFHPSNRPSFASLVEDLENFQEKCKQMSEAEISQYSPTFIDVHGDVLESLSEEEEEEEETEEEAATRGLFTPNSRTVTGGGSVRLTQSAKQKRLSDLLGSAERPEKLVVDLHKISRKRTHSLEDSKHSTKNIHFDVSAHDHFPAAGEYDHHGYLEPRGTKGGGRYLELMNYAPELFHLQDPYGNPLVSGNGSTFLPVHVTHKGYNPSNVSYTLLSPDEDMEDANCHRSSGFTAGHSVNGLEDRLYTQAPTGLVSAESRMSPKARNDDNRHRPSSRTPEKHLRDYHHHSTLLSPAAMMGTSSPPRKFADQDLYSSTVPYRQRPPSSASGYQDHRYASVECNNNRSSTSNGNVSSDQDSVNDSNGFMRNRHDSNSSFHTYTKSGLEQPLSVNLPAPMEDESSKLSSTREAWASHLEEDSGMNSECNNDIVNHQGHGHHSSRSRGQVYPEKNTATLVGYGNSHVSLV